MADSKITALTALTAADPANDMIPIVDVSDTPPASGNTKRISINNILACSPSATLASLNVTGSSMPANGLYLPTTNTLEFSANTLAQYRIAPLGVFSWYDGAGGTRMTLNSTGLGIGGAPAGRLSLQTTSGQTNLTLKSAGSTLGAIIGLQADGTAYFYQGDALPITFSTTGTERMRIDASGNLAFANGKGIDFSAVTGGTGTATGNVLNDYEEGTWTPTIVGTPDAGTATYTQQIGRYTKVGRLVTVDVYVSWSAHTGTGNMRIAGLPFTTASSPYSSVSFGYLSGIALTAGNTMIGFTQLSDTKIELWQTPTGGGTSTAVPVDAAGEIICSVTYTVA